MTEKIVSVSYTVSDDIPRPRIKLTCAITAAEPEPEPPDISHWCLVHLRDTRDWRAAVYRAKVIVNKPSLMDYMWFDGGNFSCDCNRSLFFAEALGLDEDEFQLPCQASEPGIIAIDRIVDEESGEQICGFEGEGLVFDDD